MSLRDPIPVECRAVFQHGVYVVGPVTPVADFDAPVRGTQKRDPETGEPVWQVPVMDADPETRAADKTIAVKITSALEPVVPPVPPQLLALGLQMVPIELEGLTVRPYVPDGSSRIAWTVRARGLRLAGTPVAVREERAAGTHSRPAAGGSA
ncbi:plasmid replication, integration and excision activator [Nonomuraea sp. NPDC050394]|uniref:plasmid replication, integration and excision activator n=1 Tax=Nonomuraea sp. NPDC050394 TaxID=3364363 RepID=UPI0037B72821